MSDEENKTQIDKLLEVMTDYGITSYIGLNFAEIRKEIIEVRKELSKLQKENAELKEKIKEYDIGKENE